MHKKRKRAVLHQLKTRKKLHRWRQLARQLLQGHLTFSQLERTVGSSTRSVLKTAAYLSTKEGMPIPDFLSQAVSQVIGPEAAIAAGATRSTAPSPRPRTATLTAELVETVTKPSPPTPRKRRSAAAAAPQEATAQAEPAAKAPVPKPTRPRSRRTSASKKKAE